MMYYESRGESISGLLKQQSPIPIQPVKAIEVGMRNTIDRAGPDTGCIFEVTLYNVSEGDIDLSNFTINMDTKSEYKMNIFEPSNQTVSLDFGESYAMIIGFTKSHNINDNGKNSHISLLTFNFSFTNRDNDKGQIDIKLEKPTEEMKLLRLIPIKKTDLILKYQSVSEIKFLLSSAHDKDLFFRIDKNIKDSSALSIHKIIVEAPARGSGNYELKTGDFIEVKLIVFAKARGIFSFDYIKIFGLINRQTTVIEYLAPAIIVE